MECLLQEDLCYTSISPMIQAQQAALAQRLSTLCSALDIHQGLEYFKQPNVEPLRSEQIPGRSSILTLIFLTQIPAVHLTIILKS